MRTQTIKLGLFVAVLSATFATAASAQQLQVKIDTGAVEGKVQGAARAFLGIPYAAPPVGDLRWKAPQPAARWTEVRKATEFGARCMQWDKELGSLEVGKKADVTLLDIRRPEWQPVHNPIANLVYCAHGGCADTVIVDGRILMRGGKVLTLDEHDLYEEAQDRATSLIRRTGLEQAVASIWPIH